MTWCGQARQGALAFCDSRGPRLSGILCAVYYDVPDPKMERTLADHVPLRHRQFREEGLEYVVSSGT